MMRALYSSASGMMAQQLNMDTIANNLSNVNTYGYKKQRVEFQDILYATLRPAQSAIPVGIQVGAGVRPSAITQINTAGNLQPSDSDYDIAISGPGYFRIINPADDAVPFYTRDGSFKRDAEGNLTTSEGYYLDDGNGQPVQLPEGAYDFSVGANGEMTYKDADGNLQTLGNLQIFTFVNPSGLNRVGRNLLQETPASGQAVGGDPGTEGRGTLVHKFLESSNVAVVDEMVAMITASRAYEANTKGIQSADEMLQQANNLKR